MGDLLRQASQWLAQMRTAHCSSGVIYRRGSTEQVIQATRGRTQYEAEDSLGLRTLAEATDFIVAAVEFVPAFWEPQIGDQIVADGCVYEVMSPGGQNYWQWSDPYHTSLRIHTKQVDRTDGV